MSPPDPLNFPFAQVKTRHVFGIVLLGSFVGGLVIHIIFAAFRNSKELSAVDSMAVNLLTGFLILVLLLKILCKNVDLKSVFSFSLPSGALRHALFTGALGFLIAIFAIASITGLTLLLWPTGLETLFNATHNPTNFNELSWYFLTAVVLAPILEEFIFRGLLLERWSFKWGVRRGLLLTSLAFALVHFPSHGVMVTGPFLAGFLLGYLRLRFASLWLPILAHMVNNALVILVLFIVVWLDPSSLNETSSTEDVIPLVLLAVFCLLPVFFGISHVAKEARKAFNEPAFS